MRTKERYPGHLTWASPDRIKLDEPVATASQSIVQRLSGFSADLYCRLLLRSIQITVQSKLPPEDCSEVRCASGVGLVTRGFNSLACRTDNSPSSRSCAVPADFNGEKLSASSPMRGAG